MPQAIPFNNPLLRLSALLHCGAGCVLLWHILLWPLAWGVVAVNHLVIAWVGIWPQSRWLGPNLCQLPAAAAARGEIALTIDDGPDAEVTPLVLDLLDKFDVKASFFCIGAAAAANAGLCRDIVRRGHTVENHTQRHRRDFAFSGVAQTRRELAAAQASLGAAAGGKPRFFRPPAGVRNILLWPALQRLDLQLVSWNCRGYDTVARDPAWVTRRLLRGLRAGAIILLHDGNAARTRGGVPVILEVLPPLLRAAQAAGLRCVTLRAAIDGAAMLETCPR